MSGQAFDSIVVRLARVPMHDHLRSAHGTIGEREVVLIEARSTDGVAGWGECAALDRAGYWHETARSAYRRLVEDLAPRLIAADHHVDIPPVIASGAPDDAPMAFAALEMAYLDARLTASDVSLATWLGATRDRVPAGAAIGRTADESELAEQVARLAAAGYRRVKLKVEPDWAEGPAAAAQNAAGDMAVQVDANGSFDPRRPEHLATLAVLDELGLTMIEQPFPPSEVDAAADLAARLSTPLCVDEGATSVETITRQVDSGAASIVCLKPGRLGGLVACRDAAELCAGRGWSAWAGGMVDTGIGKSALLAVAALDACDRVGDLSESARWFPDDTTVPHRIVDGCIEVPGGPGLGCAVDREAIERFTVHATTVDHRAG